jgi:hypothetical protein
LKIARDLLTFAALTVLPLVFLNAGSDSNQEVGDPFNHLGCFLFLTTSMI